MKKRKTLKYHSEFLDKIVEVYLKVANYANNGRLYIGLINAETDEPYMDLTTNLPNDCYGKTETFINKWAMSDNTFEFIEDNDLGEPSGYAVRSGYLNYPVYEFNEKRLKELDPEGYAGFEKAYDEFYGVSEKAFYKYYSTQRPVDVGTFPKTENGPVEIVNFDKRENVEAGKIQAWGYLVYCEPLTEKQIDDYELMAAPDNPDIQNEEICDVGKKLD